MLTMISPAEDIEMMLRFLSHSKTELTRVLSIPPALYDKDETDIVKYRFICSLAMIVLHSSINLENTR